MKARLVKTSFWHDEKVELLSPDAKYLLLCSITNPYIGLTGAYQISTTRISFETGYPTDRVLIGYDELKMHGFGEYSDGWVVIYNTEKHNNYSGGSKTAIAYEQEFNRLPEWIKDTLSKGYAYSQKTEIRNKKTEYRKQNTEKESNKTLVSNKAHEELRKKVMGL